MQYLTNVTIYQVLEIKIGYNKKRELTEIAFLFGEISMKWTNSLRTEYAKQRKHF